MMMVMNKFTAKQAENDLWRTRIPFLSTLDGSGTGLMEKDTREQSW